MLKTYSSWQPGSTVLLLTLCLHTFCMTAPAAGKDRDQRLRQIISKQQIVSQTFDQAWMRLPKSDDDHGLIGTAIATIGWPQSFCASIAFLVGKDRIYERLGEFESPQIKHGMTGAQRAREVVSAYMLDNQIDAAEQALALSKRARIERWNLSCVRQYGIGKQHYLTSNTQDAQFAVVDDELQILGEINPGFFHRFRAVLKRNRQIKTIVLGSGGGSVRDAIQAGLLIRARRLNTTLFADCLSACPLIFLGGVQRTIAAPYPSLGFHQASRDGRAVPYGHPLYKRLDDYARLMGVDGGFLIRSMKMAEPTKMYYPDVHTLCEPNFATWIQRSC